MNRLTSLAAVVLVAWFAGAATHVGAASTIDKRMILTFSKPVQVPGTTLPAGTYVFRLADPQYQKIWWVYDATEHKLLATFFCVPTKRSFDQMLGANNKVVVLLHETPAGVAPAIRNVYYPTERWGNEFLYPMEQAKQLAAATHHRVLASGSNATTTTVPSLVFAQPDGTLVTPDSQAVGTSGTTEPQPVGTTGDGDDNPVPAP
jgi:hypothetical protein